MHLEVAENGIFLGEMDAKLLQKIEELTLYTIQQQKELEVQRKAFETQHQKQNLRSAIGSFGSPSKKLNNYDKITFCFNDSMPHSSGAGTGNRCLSTGEAPTSNRYGL